MGGSQSSSGDGTRNVTIETEEGEVDVKLTEDFISHVTKGGNGSPRNGQSRTTTSDNMGSSSAIPSSAQEILYGSSDSAPSLQISGKWKDLYEEEKRKNESFQKINDEEFNKGVEEVQNELRLSDLGTLMPLCEENRIKVAQCYSDRPTRTLDCSDVVNQYMQCVKQARKRQVVQTLNTD